MNEIEQIEHPTPEEFEYYARMRAHLEPLLKICEYNCISYARDHGGVSYGGELVNGKVVGALHFYNQRPVYKQVPNTEHIAAWYVDNMESHELQALITELLDKIRTDHMMAWMRGRPEFEFITKYLNEFEDGYRTAYGNAAFRLRTTAPDDKCEVLPLDNAAMEEEDA